MSPHAKHVPRGSIAKLVPLIFTSSMSPVVWRGVQVDMFSQSVVAYLAMLSALHALSHLLIVLPVLQKPTFIRILA